MNRLLVALLAAFDAVIVVAVGLAAALAPLTLVWVFALGGGADWAALWPAAARVWQVGHLVPLAVALDAEAAAAIGIPAEGASFVLSLAPLAFAVFTAVFAARSGTRAAHAGAWVTGVGAGTATVAALAALVSVSSPLAVVSVDGGTSILLPTLVFGTASLGGALVGAWREGDAGILDRLRHRADVDGTGIVEASARGIAAAVVGVVALGAIVTAVGLALRGSEIVALFEAAHLDLLGVVVVSLGQLAYLPTLVVWAAAYAAGPGFALGAGTAVSPGGTSLGVVPGIPVLGIIPESPSAWLLLLALGVVAAGALAGWTARARLQVENRRESLIEDRGEHGEEPLVPRLIVWGLLVAGSAAAAALLSAAASGAIGPERLQHTGPSAAAVALAVAIEIALGAGAVLLAPRRDSDAESDAGETAAFDGTEQASLPTIIDDDAAPGAARTSSRGPFPPHPLEPSFEASPFDVPPRDAVPAQTPKGAGPADAETEDLSDLADLFRDDPEEPGSTPRAPVD
jgi:hypothetical protein